MTQSLSDREVTAPARRPSLPVWFGIAIVVWSCVLLLLALSWQGVISADGVEQGSTWLIQWPMAVPALVTLLAALGAIMTFRRGKVHVAKYLFICTLVTGIVGLLSSIFSIAALFAIRADR